MDNTNASRIATELAQRTEQLQNLMGDLERAYDLTLQALGDALELHDAETAAHSRRVTAFTVALARGMRLPGDEIRIVARGAFLHDVGKLAVPPAILRQPGALTPDETRSVREHCAHGYRLVHKIPFLAKAAEVIYAHHENWDGSGYPRGLKRNDIALGARMVAVANALDAMTSHQPHRQAKSVRAARDEIGGWSGRQFDPEVVRVFVNLPESIWEDLRREINNEIQRSTAVQKVE